MKITFLVIISMLSDGTVQKEEKQMRNIIECEMLKHQRSFQIPGRFLIWCSEERVI